ncbi:hypothetical protein C8F01DRAFT_1143173 [Mycena amicta]|nr:hypothetical protein C8F01DRAFT_1143173 [Mycena amicta]
MPVLSRQEILDLLAAMGVRLPPKTKLPDTELDKRLSKTLDSAQYLSRVVPDPPLDPTIHPCWFDKTRKSMTVLDGIHRHNMLEAGMNAQQRATGTEAFPLFGNPFMDLRQTLMAIAKTCDEGRVGTKIPPIAIQDEADTSGIAMRVLDVRQFDASTPILIVIYRHDLEGSLSPETHAWMQNNVAPGKVMMKITATLKEQELLLRILKQNSKRLAKSYKPKRAAYESPFKLSFLLPIGPLSARDLAKHNTNTGCILCGEPAKARCSHCVVMRYCDSVCQKHDWKAHRLVCKSWQGGTWQSVTFTTAQNRPGGLYIARISKFDIVQHNELQERANVYVGDNIDTSSPENTHGLTPFIVKVQVIRNTIGPGGLPARQMDAGMHGDKGAHIMVYDERRELDVMLWREPTTMVQWDKIAALVAPQRRMPMINLKVFCWAVRTGDWTLDICLDRFPEPQVW